MDTTTRRFFLLAGTAAATGLALRHVSRSGPVVAAKADTPHNVTLVNFSDKGENLGKVTVPTIEKTEAEWKQLLPRDSFEVTRHADTERPFTGKYVESTGKGIYRCICCDTALFLSGTQFDSGTGWPSFYQPIAKENVHEISDDSLGMERIAVSCRRCEAHLGHVFDDGPRPTGLRYCMNSVSLKFIKFA